MRTRLTACLLLSLCLGCDRSKDRGEGTVQGPAAQPATLIVFVEFPSTTVAKPTSIQAISKVTVQIHDRIDRLLKAQDLNVTATRFWGRIEVAAAESLRVSLAFFEEATVRWFGQQDGVDALPGAEVEVRIFPEPLERTVYAPASVEADSTFQIAWLPFPGATAYELQESQVDDFSALTDSGEDDASVGISMFEQIEGTIAQFTADGAYDTRPMYAALAASGAADISIVIPPKKTATVDSRAVGPWRQRNHAIERIDEVGRRQWRKESGAHRQARAENGMYRYKRIVGDRLRAQHYEAQQKEALIAVNVINRMSALGMPESVKIVA